MSGYGRCRRCKQHRSAHSGPDLACSAGAGNYLGHKQGAGAATTFRPDEIKLLGELLLAAFHGRDVKVMVRNAAMPSLLRKVQNMEATVARKKAESNHE